MGTNVYVEPAQDPKEETIQEEIITDEESNSGCTGCGACQEDQDELPE